MEIPAVDLRQCVCFPSYESYESKPDNPKTYLGQGAGNIQLYVPSFRDRCVDPDMWCRTEHLLGVVLLP